MTRVYLPPDANTLLSVADHCLRSTDYINVIVADKQKHLQFTTIDEAVVHCTKGMGIWAKGEHRCRATSRTWCWRAAAMSPRMEALAAAAILREQYTGPEAPFHQRGGSVQAAAGVRASPRLHRS